MASRSGFRFDRVSLAKPLRFGLYGGLGCLATALILGELLLYAIMPETQTKKTEELPKPQVDIFFVLDATSSMQGAINGVSDGITGFTDELGKKGIDVRVGLVAFRDLRINEAEDLLLFKGEPFTNDFERFRRDVRALRARGGGDPAESSLDALGTAARQPFRKEAIKVVVLITDEEPHIPDQQQRRPEDIGKLLKDNGIDQLYLVIDDKDSRVYESIQKFVGGSSFPLRDAARGRSDYDKLLPEISKEIAKKADEKGIKGLQSNQEYSSQAGMRILLAVALWTAVLAIGIALALIIGQNHYLKRGWLSPQEGLRGGLGALAAGVAAGFVGQGLFSLGVTDSSFLRGFLRLIGWTLLGALLGLGMSFFVKNLRLQLAAAGGAIGGLIGAIFFMITSALFGDIVGRLLGGFILGFGIGMMVALIEMAFRKAWLEVHYGPREVISVNLGPEPVKVGGDGKACTVWARGAAPVAFRFWIREGKVICEDVDAGGSREAANGLRLKVGSIEVIVRTGGEEIPLPPAPPPRMESSKPAPRMESNKPVAPAAPPALPSNPKELKSPPLPPLPPRPAPTPIVEKKPAAPLPEPKPSTPVPPVVEKKPSAPSPSPVTEKKPTPAPTVAPPPAAEKKSPPPPPPSTAPPPTNPSPPEVEPGPARDACPGCGRKIPGRVGLRYCMVCDQNF